MPRKKKNHRAKKRAPHEFQAQILVTKRQRRTPERFTETFHVSPSKSHKSHKRKTLSPAPTSSRTKRELSPLRAATQSPPKRTHLSVEDALQSPSPMTRRSRSRNKQKADDVSSPTITPANGAEGQNNADGEPVVDISPSRNISRGKSPKSRTILEPIQKVQASPIEVNEVPGVKLSSKHGTRNRWKSKSPKGSKGATETLPAEAKIATLLSPYRTRTGSKVESKCAAAEVASAVLTIELMELKPAEDAARSPQTLKRPKIASRFVLSKGAEPLVEEKSVSVDSEEIPKRSRRSHSRNKRADDSKSNQESTTNFATTASSAQLDKAEALSATRRSTTRLKAKQPPVKESKFEHENSQRTQSKSLRQSRSRKVTVAGTANSVPKIHKSKRSKKQTDKATSVDVKASPKEPRTRRHNGSQLENQTSSDKDTSNTLSVALPTNVVADFDTIISTISTEAGKASSGKSRLQRDTVLSEEDSTVDKHSTKESKSLIAAKIGPPSAMNMDASIDDLIAVDLEGSGEQSAESADTKKDTIRIEVNNTREGHQVNIIDEPDKSEDDFEYDISETPQELLAVGLSRLSSIRMKVLKEFFCDTQTSRDT